MRAALYKEQQEAERARRDPVFAAERQSKRLIGIDVSKLKGKNQGVSQRNMRDMEHVKVGFFPFLACSLYFNLISCLSSVGCHY